MIKLEIISDLKNGSKGKCDAENSTVEEVTMMIALLGKYLKNIQNKFDKLSDFSYDTGICKKKVKDK